MRDASSNAAGAPEAGWPAPPPESQRRLRFLRGIAESRVGAALRRRQQRHRSVGVAHRNAHDHVVTVVLDVLLERLVELDLALREDRLAERGAARRGGIERELEAFPIQVIAVRDLVVHLDVAGVDRARAEHERLVGLEEGGLRGRPAERRDRQHDEPGTGARRGRAQGGSRKQRCDHLSSLRRVTVTAQA